MKYMLKLKGFMLILGMSVALVSCKTIDKVGCCIYDGIYSSDHAGTGEDAKKAQMMGNVGDRVFFVVDSARLSSESRKTISKQVKWLKSNKSKVSIEGHADARGTREYNLALGARRANSVKDYIISQGIHPRRLKTVSYGKERPVSLCDKPACWNKNRRVVLSVR